MILHTYYLHCKLNKTNKRSASPRPDWFSYEDCFENFTSTMCDTNLTLLIDGDRSPAHPLIDSPIVPTFIDNNSFRKIYFNAAIDCGTTFDHCLQGYPIAWKNVVETIMGDIENGKIRGDDLIYIVEDDYIHVQNWYDCVMDLFFDSHPEFLATTYVTLYDHPDKYIDSIQPVKSYVSDKYRLYISKYRHWRQTPNGCGNFVVSMRLFKKDFEIMKIHSDGIRSKKLNEVGRQYLSPIPGLSSHMHNSYPSPIINWRDQLNGK